MKPPITAQSVREMVKRGNARSDGRVGSCAQVGEVSRNAASRAIQAGALVLCAPKRGAEVRGVVVWHSGPTLVLDADGARVLLRGCPRARIYILSKPRRDGIQ